MDASFLSPEQAGGGGNLQSLQAALLRLTPEQRKMMFEPYKEELEGLNAQMAPQKHISPMGALFGGVGNALASFQRGGALGREQKNAQDLFGALYGQGGGAPAGPPAAPGGSPLSTTMGGAASPPGAQPAPTQGAAPGDGDKQAMIAALLRKQYPFLAKPLTDEDLGINRELEQSALLGAK